MLEGTMNFGNVNMNHSDNLMLENIYLSLRKQRSTIQKKIARMEEILKQNYLARGSNVPDEQQPSARLEVKSSVEQISDIRSKILAMKRFLESEGRSEFDSSFCRTLMDWTDEHDKKSKELDLEKRTQQQRAFHKRGGKKQRDIIAEERDLLSREAKRGFLQRVERQSKIVDDL